MNGGALVFKSCF